MRVKYYCKKCGKVIETEEHSDQFGELKKVWCNNCRGGVRMWKVIAQNDCKEVI